MQPTIIIIIINSRPPKCTDRPPTAAPTDLHEGLPDAVVLEAGPQLLDGPREAV